MCSRTRYFSIVVSVCSKFSYVEGVYLSPEVQQLLLNSYAKMFTFYTGGFATH